MFLDLGFAPPSNAYLRPEALDQPEIYLPLKLYVCAECWLVQTEDFARPEDLFGPDYAYFSSASSSWLAHAADYASMIQRRLNLGDTSFVVEIASNDGYLLQHFTSAGIPCLGIEPTESTADAAENLGIPVVRDFFSEALGDQLSKSHRQADLIVGNNVYAHVPDINDFTAGLRTLLTPGGTITLEFPHLMRLIENGQFDTVYHEHFSYLSLATVSRIFEQAKLRVFDVEELPAHGGSLRVFGCHIDDPRPAANAVSELLKTESNFGLQELSTYSGFQGRVDALKYDLLCFLIDQKRAGKSTVGYGAAAKGNTILNHAGIKPDLLPLVVDAAPSKQGKLMPGSHIPIVATAELNNLKPEWVLILPWNIADEITAQHEYIHDWGGRFVTAIPELQVW